MTLPKTYKRAIFTEAGSKLKVEEAPLQQPGKNEVLVKVDACGVCHSDTFAQANAYGVGFPFTPGHEIIGRVVALGEGVEGWKVGERIGGGWHGGHDGTCNTCRQGFFQGCDNEAINGITRAGGYAEYVLLRAEAGVRVPDDIDAVKFAPLLCAGVTVFNGIRRMNVGPGATVAIQGLGGLGHLAVQYANKFGYRVVAISRGSDKEKFARQLGAHEFVDTSKGDAGEALQKLGGANMIVATAPNPEAIRKLVSGLAPQGKLLVLSVPEGALTLDFTPFISKGLSLHGWPSGHSVDMEEAVIFSKLEDVDCLVEKFSLDNVNDAFDAMTSGKVRFRAVISFE